jgi:hypothetical protein
MVTVIGLDGGWQGIRLEVGSYAGFDMAENVDIAGVADRVRANAERAAVENIEELLNFRLSGEQLVFIDELDSAANEIVTADR